MEETIFGGKKWKEGGFSKGKLLGDCNNLIDIDNFEINKFEKFGLKIDLKIKSDAKKIIKHLLKLKIETQKKEIGVCKNQINIWKNKYPIISKKNYKKKKYVHMYL